MCVCIISLPASIQETQWSAANVVMRNSLSDLTFDVCFSLGQMHHAGPLPSGESTRSQLRAPLRSVILLDVDGDQNALSHSKRKNKQYAELIGQTSPRNRS